MPIVYEPCVVSFIDVLGFREIITSRSPGDVFNALTLLEKFTRPDDEEDSSKSNKEKRLQSRAFAYALSDTVVRVRPYDTQYHDGALFSELLDLLHSQVSLVANGVLIRAGVTVGDVYVGENGEGPIFGPAVVRAHEIESEEAVFPRVVVDEDAIRQHRSDPRLRNEDNTLEFEIRAIVGLLTTGEDGTQFIDYLRASRSEHDDLGSYLEFLKSHANLVQGGLGRARSRRVKRKYEWLARYHDRCISELLEEAQASSDLSDALYEEGLPKDACDYIEELFIEPKRPAVTEGAK